VIIGLSLPVSRKVSVRRLLRFFPGRTPVLQLAGSSSTIEVEQCTNEPMKLFHSVLRHDSDDKPLPPLVIIHGVMGSTRIYQSWVKQIHKRDNGRRDIICIDLRNHGRTAAAYGSLEMNYRLMANDVLMTLNTLRIKSAHIIGHSMGGKLAAALSVINTQHNLLNSGVNSIDILSVTMMDISPVDYSKESAFEDVNTSHSTLVSKFVSNRSIV